MGFRFSLKMDFGSWPTWYADGERCGDFDPAELPLSQDTLKRLNKWADVYNSAYEDDYPYRFNFPSPETERLWSREGFRLWAQLHHELGSDYQVSSKIFYQDKDLTVTFGQLPEEITSRCKDDIDNASQSLL
ncbi:MAG: hypothetical protein AAFY26_01840 [Cyanobacteria bacterium J06638_22]